MRIVHIIPFLWSGAGSVVSRLAADQAKCHRVHLITSGRIGELADWPSYRRRLRAAGVTLHRLNFFKREPATFWPEVERLRRLLGALRPDLVHTHAGVPTAAAAIARDSLDASFPVVAHMYNWTPGRPEWMNEMDTWAFRRADRIICSARGYEKQFRRAGIPARKLIYLSWGLPLTAEASAAPAKRSSAEVVIGFVGRLEPRKDQLRLIETLALLRRKHPEIVLELVGPDGDSDYGRRVRARSERADVAGAVRCLGAVADPAAVMRRWSVFVSASLDEGQGLAIQEAMWLGVPVVARKAAGVEDYISHRKTGRLVASDDNSVLAEAIVDASRPSPENRRIVAGARGMIRRRYLWTTMLTRLERIYSDCRTRRGN